MRFIYFGKHKFENTGHGVTCVGYTLDKDVLKMSFAFCSPNDHFSRSKAREIVQGRMEKGMSVVVNGVPDDVKYEEVIKVAKEVLKNAFDTKEGSVGKMVQDSGYKHYPKIGGVNLPFWYTGVE